MAAERTTTWRGHVLALVYFALVVVAPLAALIDLAWPVSLTPIECEALQRGAMRSLGLAVAVASATTMLAVLLARTIPPVLLLGSLLLGRFVVAHGVLALGLAPGAVAGSMALVVDLAPFAAMIVLLRLRTRPIALLEAAADLGAAPWTRAWQVDWPHLRPALLATFVWVLLQALADVIAFELAGGGHAYTLGLLIRDALIRDDAPDRALVAVVMLLVLALPCAVAIARELTHAEQATVALAPAPAWMRTLGWGSFVAILLGPALLLSGAHPRGFGPSDVQLAELFGRTLAIAGVVAVIASAAGFGLAILARRLGARSVPLTVAVLAPLAIPPSVLGLLILAAATRVGWPPGVALTIAALLGPAVALGFIAARVLISAIPTALLDAAADLGASGRDRMRLVWLPLGRPALIVAAVVVLAWVIGQAAIPAFTSGPGGDTLAVALTIHARAGAMELVRRWSLVLVVAAIVGAIAVERVARRRRS
jgi:ABC-type spermidine/putrescine transport system permease subunit II